MSNGTVKGTRKLTTANTYTNAVSFLIEALIRDGVNTAEVVAVMSVEAGGPGGMTGYVNVKPLVCQLDASGNALPPAEIARLPYSRIQGGIAALVMDPQPGDIGLAVFAKRDSSGVRRGAATPVPPGSFRQFDQADGFYIGGFLNKAPEIWLELNQQKQAVLHAPVSVTIKTAQCTVDAPETLFTGNITVAGNATAAGNITWGGTAQGQGGPAQFSNGINNSGGSIVSGSLRLDTHTHGGISRGNSNTNPPA